MRMDIASRVLDGVKKGSMFIIRDYDYYIRLTIGTKDPPKTHLINNPQHSVCGGTTLLATPQ